MVKAGARTKCSHLRVSPNTLACHPNRRFVSSLATDSPDLLGPCKQESSFLFVMTVEGRTLCHDSGVEEWSSLHQRSHQESSALFSHEAGSEELSSFQKRSHLMARPSAPTSMSAKLSHLNRSFSARLIVELEIAALSKMFPSSQ